MDTSSREAEPPQETRALTEREARTLRRLLRGVSEDMARYERHEQAFERLVEDLRSRETRNHRDHRDRRARWEFWIPAIAVGVLLGVLKSLVVVMNQQGM